MSSLAIAALGLLVAVVIYRALSAQRHAYDDQTRILHAMRDHEQWFAYELGKAVELRAARVYPNLTLLQEQGLLTDGWETPIPVDRPQRRWYQLTDAGRADLVARLR